MRNIRFPIARPTLLRAALLLGVTMIATPGVAQYIGNAPPPPLPVAPRAGEVESPAASLARAVRTLAQSPRDFRALIDAGHAAVELGDTQTAIGFFGRAEEVRPSDPAPKIGMGAATVATGDARGALAWFFQAQQLGASAAAIGADRGLAQDLLGNQAAAQIDYRVALAGPERDEARRRLALSLGISGNREAAFATLQPLLMRRDPGVQRVRAFVLALVGDERGASNAIDAAMPGTGARMAGFFRLLPDLSAIQKAAAVHLGVFPDPSEIRVAAVAPPPPTATPPLSRRAARRALAAAPAVARAKAAQAPATPPRQTPRLVVVDPVLPPATSKFDFRRPTPRVRPRSSPAIEAPMRVPTPLGSPAPAVQLPPVATIVDPASAAVLELSRPPETVAAAAPSPSVSLPAPASPAFSSSAIVPVSGDRLSGIDRLLAQADELPVPPAPRPRFERLAPATAAADRPVARGKAAEARKLSASRKVSDARKLADAAAAEEKAARAAIGISGTHWVQLAGGSHADRMATEFKKLGARSAALRKRGGAVTGGKDYFRLLTGPFGSRSEAQQFVNLLAKDGVDGFSWTRTPATLRIEKIAPK